MKKIAIIAAMEEEVEEIKNIMVNIKEKNIYNIKIYEGNIDNKECILIESGIGKVNASRATQIIIDNYNIEYVINVGSAGAANDNLEIGDIVIGDILVQHDFDITAFGHEKGYISNIGKNIKSDKSLLKQAKDTMKIVIKEEITKGTKNCNGKNSEEHDVYIENKIVVGTIASGDIFCTERAMKEKIHKKFNAECIEMEGAAIAQVCFLTNIPIIVIRSISDSPNGKNHITFDKYLKLASRRCALFIEHFLDD